MIFKNSQTNKEPLEFHSDFQYFLHIILDIYIMLDQIYTNIIISSDYSQLMFK